MNIILCEKNYYESNWCRQILHGLKNELKKRRMEYELIFEFEVFDQDVILYVIGSDFRWMSEAVCHANACGITPIVVFNQLDHIINGKYHSVSSDIGGSVTSLIEWLKAENKDHICLYGINPSSISDISRTESYFRRFAEGGRTFFNSGSLQKCFEDFREGGELFDAVICTNDFAAISLVKNLLAYDSTVLESLTVISCSKSALSDCFAPYIKSVDINFTSFGTNAYAISRILAHGENISEIALTVKWDMTFGEKIPVPESPHLLFGDNGFYEDPELAALLKLDRLWEGCDALDKKLLRLLLSEKTYAEIAEECHLAEQSVKYRVKQYLAICELKNRKDLLSLLREYHISP